MTDCWSLLVLGRMDVKMETWHWDSISWVLLRRLWRRMTSISLMSTHEFHLMVNVLFRYVWIWWQIKTQIFCAYDIISGVLWCCVACRNNKIRHLITTRPLIDLSWGRATPGKNHIHKRNHRLHVCYLYGYLLFRYEQTLVSPPPYWPFGMYDGAANCCQHAFCEPFRVFLVVAGSFEM